MADEEEIATNTATDDSEEDAAPAGLSPDTVLSLIEKYESGGRNILQQVVSPKISTASGYYQITNTTWRDIAPKIGIDTSKHPTAMSAPREVQRKAALALYNERGIEPWSSNKALMKIVGGGAANAQQTSTGSSPQQSQLAQPISYNPDDIFNEPDNSSAQAAPRRSFDQNFNTILSPEEENKFQEWKSKNAPNDSGEDYDLRGAFKNGLTRDQKNGHFEDTYKKPNHPTFSNESKYAPYGNPGHWDGEKFIPAEAPPQAQQSAAPQATSALWNQFKEIAEKKKAQADLTNTPASNVQTVEGSNAAAANKKNPQRQALAYALHPPPRGPVQSIVAPQQESEIPAQPADATKQYQPPPEVVKSIAAYHDKTAQEIAGSTGQPVRGASGIYRPTGDGGAVLSSPETEAKLQKVSEDRIKRDQNVALSNVSKSIPSGVPSLIAGLASQSQVAKDIVGTGVVAADALLGGIPKALFPKEVGGLEEVTLNPDPTIRTLQQGVGGLAAIIPIGYAGKLAKIGLARIGVESGIAETAAAFGTEAIPREAIKTISGQETPGEAVKNVAESAATGAVLHGSGELGSALAKTADVGRIGTAAIRGTAGVAGMELPLIASGQAPDLQSALMGLAFEGRAGAREGAARGDVNFFKRDVIKTLDKENLIDNTVLAVSDASKADIGRSDVVKAVKSAVEDGNAKPADVLNAAVEKLHEKFGGETDKTDFVNAVGKGINDRIVSKPVAEAPKGEAAPAETSPLEGTPHVAHTPGKYETADDLIEREIKTGKNAGKKQMGVWADVSYEQAEAITGKRPIAGEESKFFIPEKYVTRPTNAEPQNAEEARGVDEPVPVQSVADVPPVNRAVVEGQEGGTASPGRKTKRSKPIADEGKTAEPISVDLGNDRGAQAEETAAPVQELLKEGGENATTIRDERPSGLEQHRGITEVIQEEGQDRSINTTIRGGSAQAGDSNSALEETPVGKITPEQKQKIFSELPVNDGSNIKDIRDYAIRNRVPTVDAEGKNLSWNTILKAVREDAVRKFEDQQAQPIAPAKGNEAKASPAASSSDGILYSSVTGLTPETFKIIGRQAKGTYESDIKPKFFGAVDWARRMKEGAQRVVAPQTITASVDANTIAPRDLHKQEFSYNGNDFRVKSEVQPDKSVRNAYYQKTADGYRRLTKASEELRNSLHEAAKNAYVENTRSGALQTALLMRDITGTQKRNIAIRDKDVEELRKVFDQNSVADNHSFISDIMKGRMDFNDDIKNQGAQQVRKIFKEQGERIMNEAAKLGKDIHFDLNDKFFSLLWKDTSKATLASVMSGKNPAGGSKYFLSKKIFADIAEGLEKGLTPKYDNPFDFVMHYVGESEKLIAGLTATKSLKDMNLGRIAGNRKNAPVGWEKVDALAKWGRNEQGDLIKRGDFYAPKGAAAVLNNYFSSGLGGSAAYQGWMTLNNHLNQLQLSLSGFHATFVTMESIMSKAALGLREFAYGSSQLFNKNTRKSGWSYLSEAGLNIVTSPSAPFNARSKSGLVSDVRTEWLGKDSGNDTAKILADALMRGGFEGAMPHDYKTGGFREAKQAFKNDNAFGGALRGALAGTEWLTKTILEKYVPTMKFGAATQLMDFELRKFSNMMGRDATPIEQRGLAAKVVDVVDDRFGLLAYDNLFWDKTFKHTLMGLTRSVGWNYGVLRTMFGGVFDYAKNTTRLAGKTGVFGKAYQQNAAPEFTHRMSYLTALPIITGVAGAVLNTILTGEAPQDLKDFFFPRTGGTDENGNPSRISLPSYINDAIHLSMHPLRTIMNKTAPAITFFNNILTNADWQNREIVSHEISSPADFWKPEALKSRGQFAVEQFFPFPVKQVQQMMEGNATAISLLPSAGIKPAPPWLNRTGMQEFLSERSNARMSATPKSDENVTQAKIANKIENLYRQGETQEANDLANSERAKGTISPDRIIAAYKGSHYSTKESQLKNSILPDAMTAYFERADDKEIASPELSRAMTQKLGEINLYNLTPAKAKEYSDQLSEAEANGRTQYLDQRTYHSVKKALDNYTSTQGQAKLPKINFGPVRPPAYIRQK